MDTTPIDPSHSLHPLSTSSTSSTDAITSLAQQRLSGFSTESSHTATMPHKVEPLLTTSSQYPPGFSESIWNSVQNEWPSKQFYLRYLALKAEVDNLKSQTAHLHRNISELQQRQKLQTSSPTGVDISTQTDFSSISSNRSSMLLTSAKTNETVTSIISPEAEEEKKNLINLPTNMHALDHSTLTPPTKEDHPIIPPSFQYSSSASPELNQKITPIDEVEESDSKFSSSDLKTMHIIGSDEMIEDVIQDSSESPSREGSSLSTSEETETLEKELEHLSSSIKLAKTVREGLINFDDPQQCMEIIYAARPEDFQEKTESKKSNIDKCIQTLEKLSEQTPQHTEAIQHAKVLQKKYQTYSTYFKELLAIKPSTPASQPTSNNEQRISKTQKTILPTQINLKTDADALQGSNLSYSCIQDCCSALDIVVKRVKENQNTNTTPPETSLENQIKQIKATAEENYKIKINNLKNAINNKLNSTGISIIETETPPPPYSLNIPDGISQEDIRKASEALQTLRIEQVQNSEAFDAIGLASMQNQLKTFNSTSEYTKDLADIKTKKKSAEVQAIIQKYIKKLLPKQDNTLTMNYIGGLISAANDAVIDTITLDNISELINKKTASNQIISDLLNGRKKNVENLLKTPEGLLKTLIEADLTNAQIQERVKKINELTLQIDKEQFRLLKNSIESAHKKLKEKDIFDLIPTYTLLQINLGTDGYLGSISNHENIIDEEANASTNPEQIQSFAKRKYIYKKNINHESLRNSINKKNEIDDISTKLIAIKNSIDEDSNIESIGQTKILRIKASHIIQYDQDFMKCDHKGLYIDFSNIPQITELTSTEEVTLAENILNAPSLDAVKEYIQKAKIDPFSSSKYKNLLSILNRGNPYTLKNVTIDDCKTLCQKIVAISVQKNEILEKLKEKKVANQDISETEKLFIESFETIQANNGSPTLFYEDPNEISIARMLDLVEKEPIKKRPDEQELLNTLKTQLSTLAILGNGVLYEIGSPTDEDHLNNLSKALQSETIKKYYELLPEMHETLLKLSNKEHKELANHMMSFMNNRVLKVDLVIKQLADKANEESITSAANQISILSKETNHKIQIIESVYNMENYTTHKGNNIELFKITQKLSETLLEANEAEQAKLAATAQNILQTYQGSTIEKAQKASCAYANDALSPIQNLPANQRIHITDGKYEKTSLRNSKNNGSNYDKINNIWIKTKKNENGPSDEELMKNLFAAIAVLKNSDEEKQQRIGQNVEQKLLENEWFKACMQLFPNSVPVACEKTLIEHDSFSAERLIPFISNPNKETNEQDSYIMAIAFGYVEQAIASENPELLTQLHTKLVEVQQKNTSNDFMKYLQETSSNFANTTPKERLSLLQQKLPSFAKSMQTEIKKLGDSNQILTALNISIQNPEESLPSTSSSMTLVIKETNLGYKLLYPKTS